MRMIFKSIFIDKLKHRQKPQVKIMYRTMHNEDNKGVCSKKQKLTKGNVINNGAI